ncbi:MAG: hypothetical protein KGR26_03350, partial [Cyanobacteria bacterium REEB65]|nr:hypothetical protein [Cyanobacteria bacterium REEB65]
VSALLHRREADADLRLLLMRALEFAEEAYGDSPKACPERVVALIHLHLFTLLQEEEGQQAYGRAIQDALDRMNEAFATPSASLEITRLANAWYALGFQQQALGHFTDAIKLYSLASHTALSVAEPDRSMRLLILIGTNTATCAESLGLQELATCTRQRVDDLLRALAGQHSA